MAQAKTVTRVVHRSSVDGQFITQRQAAQNPRESERERIRMPAPPSPKKGK